MVYKRVQLWAWQYNIVPVQLVRSTTMNTSGKCRHKFATIFRSVAPDCAYLDRIRQCGWCGCTVSVRTYQRDAQAQGWEIKPKRTRKRARPIRDKDTRVPAQRAAAPVHAQTATGLMDSFMLNNEVNRQANRARRKRVLEQRKAAQERQEQLKAS